MQNYKQGDIILIPFPFTDRAETKMRPAVIISKDEINDRLFIVAKITSVIRNDSFSFLINADAINLELRRESEVRTNEIFTVHKIAIIKKIASFTNREALQNLIEKIQTNIELT